MDGLVKMAGLVSILQEANAKRLHRVLQGLSADGSDSELERLLEMLFQPSQFLAIYGTLAPGASNAWVMDGIDGTWQEGKVRGHRYESGVGEAVGYPGMTWDVRQLPQSVKLFRAMALPQHWARLDEFEGSGYVRILVPVEPDIEAPEIMAIANLYALRPGSIPQRQ